MANSNAVTSTSPQVMINIKDMCAGYDHEPVLEHINLKVYEHDFIGLIGPNGGGKTTLIRVLLGLLPVRCGSVKIKGLPVDKGRKYLGYVPQLLNFDRDFPIRVRDVVRMGRLRKRGLLRGYTEADNEHVQAALRAVDLLNVAQRPLGELSGGQRQRVYIARALASEAEIMLLDEPTSNVDPQVSNSIFDLLNELNKHMTILMITHNMSAVSAYTKTIGCINHTLHYHGQKELTNEMLEATYQCPVDLIAHGVPHRVLPFHGGEQS